MNIKNVKTITIVYQPKFDVIENKVTSFEALARFIDKKGILLNTSNVIDSIHGLNNKFNLTAYILKGVLDDMSYVSSVSNSNISVSINISATELESYKFKKWITNMFKNNYKYIPFIEFELSEKFPIKNFKLLNDNILFLKTLGFKISLDDVGSKYSSLSLVDSLNLDFIKLDRDLINNISLSPLIKYIIKSAHSKGIKVVAEGIEDIQLYNLLVSYNCDFIQGYIISPPIPFNKVLSYFIDIA